MSLATRRQFVALLGTVMLSGCGSQGEPKQEDAGIVATAQEDGWHAEVVDGISFEVPDDVELVSEDYASGSHMCIYTDDGPTTIMVTISDGEFDLTGSYEVTEVGDITAYWKLADDEQYGSISFNLDGHGHQIQVMSPDYVAMTERILSTLKS